MNEHEFNAANMRAKSFKTSIKLEFNSIKEHIKSAATESEGVTSLKNIYIKHQETINKLDSLGFKIEHLGNNNYDISW